MALAATAAALALGVIAGKSAAEWLRVPRRSRDGTEQDGTERDGIERAKPISQRRSRGSDRSPSTRAACHSPPSSPDFFLSTRPRSDPAAARAAGARRSSMKASGRSSYMAGLLEEDKPHAWRGFSIEEARLHADEQQSKVLARTPHEVLADLQRGNARFWTGQAKRAEKSAFERRALISKQFPSVAILGCSDSRVPTEIVFDQGLGDIFVIRVAGNSLGTSTLASLQYAVHHLKVKVLVVLGHEMCGAVKAAMQSMESLEQEQPELELVLKDIKAGLDERSLRQVSDGRARDREAVTANVRRQVQRLTQDSGIMSKVDDQSLIVVGAFYELSSGIVDFSPEVSATLEQEVLESESSSSLEGMKVHVSLSCSTMAPDDACVNSPPPESWASDSPALTPRSIIEAVRLEEVGLCTPAFAPVSKIAVPQRPLPHSMLQLELQPRLTSTPSPAAQSRRHTASARAVAPTSALPAPRVAVTAAALLAAFGQRLA
mmetsp:Transcript_109000/g.351801  ORF Transcript_109000/g.351801 Transcript_109000/m.351801 type:complete len:490 (-) Transcript_109000:80-1549(-)